MNLKRPIFVYLFCLLALSLTAACSWAGHALEIIPTGPITSIVPHQSETITPLYSSEIWPTPIMSATPIFTTVDSGDETNDLVEKLYKVDPKCRLDLLNSVEPSLQVPSLEFIKTDVDFNIGDFWISEIADNLSGNLRAFVACDKGNCQPKILLEDRDNGSVQEINWSGRISFRPISGLMWIGNNILSFSHSTNPHDAIIAAIKIKEEDFLLYWLVGYPCQ